MSNKNNAMEQQKMIFHFLLKNENGILAKKIGDDENGYYFELPKFNAVGAIDTTHFFDTVVSSELKVQIVDNKIYNHSLDKETDILHFVVTSDDYNVVKKDNEPLLKSKGYDFVEKDNLIIMSPSSKFNDEVFNKYL